MSLAEDASTPGAVAGAGGAASITSASFTPPSASLLVALVSGESSSGPVSAVVSDSAGGSWARVASASGSSYGGYAAVFIQYLATAPASAITVTATFTGLYAGRFLDVRVATGADPVQSASTGWGATYSVTGTNAGAIAMSTTVSSSLVYGVSNCPNVAVTATAWPSTSTVLATDSVSASAAAASWKSSALTGSPSSTTLGVTWSSSAGSGNVAAFEILPLGTSGGAPTMPTFADGSVYHASDLGTIRANIDNLFNVTQAGVQWAPYAAGGKGPAKPLCVVSCETPITGVGSGSGNFVYWDTVHANSENGWDPLNSTYVLLRTAGLWRLQLQGQLLGIGSTSEIEAIIMVNSISYPTGVVAVSNATGSAVGCECTVQVPLGSYVVFQLNQYSGGVGSWGSVTAACEWLSN